MLSKSLQQLLFTVSVVFAAASANPAPAIRRKQCSSCILRIHGMQADPTLLNIVLNCGALIIMYCMHAAVLGTDCETRICPSCGEGEEELFEFGKCCPECVPAGCSEMECPLPKCLAGQTLVRQEGECCPTCTRDCKLVACPVVLCEEGSTPVVPPGQCCPRCMPDVLDCSAVLCLQPVCEEGERSVVPEGQCCPQCQPVCTVEGQIFSDCASRCPRTCNSNPDILCPTVCVSGCTCPSGQVIDTANNRCVPQDECPSNSTYTCHGVVSYIYAWISSCTLTKINLLCMMINCYMQFYYYTCIAKCLQQSGYIAMPST